MWEKHEVSVSLKSCLSHIIYPSQIFRHTVINYEIVKTQITMTLFEALNRLY